MILRHDTLVGSPESVHDMVTHEIKTFSLTPQKSNEKFCYPKTNISSYPPFPLKSSIVPFLVILVQK